MFGFGVSVVFLGFDAVWVLWFPWYFGLVGVTGYRFLLRVVWWASGWFSDY